MTELTSNIISQLDKNKINNCVIIQCIPRNLLEHFPISTVSGCYNGIWLVESDTAACSLDVDTITRLLRGNYKLPPCLQF